MERKRIGAIVALAVAATVSPLVYQYVIQPRTEASEVTITIMDVQYNDDMSLNTTTAFNMYLKLQNKLENDVILSPLQLDVYYHDTESAERYRLIGEFQTFMDYVIPANSFVASELTEEALSDRVDNHDEKGYNPGKQIMGLLKLYDTPGFRDGTNEALIRLINTGQVFLKLKGNAQFGPISMPFESKSSISLDLTVWDPELVIHDIFLLRESIPGVGVVTHNDTFVIHSKMRNPSGIPLTFTDFTLGLYNGTETAQDPITDDDQVGWGIKLRDISTSVDPQQTDRMLANVFLGNKIVYEFSADKWQWKDVFFAFNLTNPDPAEVDNIAYKEWFISTLLDKPSIEDITLKGSAVIYLGNQDGEKGFEVDMTYQNEEEDIDNHLTLTNVNFHQKNLPFYHERTNTPSFVGEDPITMFGNFSVGELQCTKMTVDTNPDDPTMTLDIDAITTLRNPYRFEYEVQDFQASYNPVGSKPFAWSKTNTSATILAARRADNETYNSSTDPDIYEYDLDLVESVTDIPINLTTEYQTNDSAAGIYKVFEDLGADTRLLNLTNPFYLPPDSPEYYNNPLTTIQFLVDEGVNPLLLLNETDLFVKVQNYQPLIAQYFDDPANGRAHDTIYQQIAGSNSDLPHLQDPLYDLVQESEYAWDAARMYNVFPSGTHTDWSDFYDDGTSEGYLRRENEYDIGALPSGFHDDYFLDDEDLVASGGNSGLVRGIILDAPAGTTNNRVGEFNSTAANGSPHSDLGWRIYQYGSFASNRWGPSYDYFNDGKKGYFMGTSLDVGNYVMFSQNFTIDPAKFVNGVSDVEEVTISMSYKYLDNTDEYDGGYDAWLMFDFMDPGTGRYNYPGGTFGPNSAYATRTGWTLPAAEDQEWQHYSVDITTEFKNRLQLMINNPGNSRYQKGEVSFAAHGDGSTPLRVHFDDIVFNIKFKDYTNTMGLRLTDLFNYLEEHETTPGQGNMFALFETLSENSEIDAMDFWEFLGNDADPLRPEGQVDVFEYFQNQNVSLSTITSIMDEQYQALGVGEPPNFLEMMTQNKYRAIRPGETWDVSTDNGPRVLKDEHWTIEDPLVASRIIIDSLYKSIFRDANGQLTPGGFDEEELWIMLEQLGVTMPWIIMYLLTQGWTKDDIFDVLNALGFGQETKENFDSGRATGDLTTEMDIHIDIYGGVISHDTHEVMVFSMDPVLDDGTQEVFSALCAAGTGDKVRTLVYNEGNPTGAEVSFQDSFDVWFIPVSYEVTVTVTDFIIEIYINPDASSLVQYPHNIEYQDYLILGAGTSSGLNDPGSQELFSNTRANVMFEGEPFITMGGDPVSFFQFLDTYYFGTVHGGVDYSSLTLMTYFDISAIDFIDILTGYNPETGVHDGNGNGRADDWIAPSHYATPAQRNAWDGWGTSFRHNTLFWNGNTENNTETGQTNGKIIWSNSPDFVDLSEPEHRIGDIIEGGPPPEDGDMINETAPPIVDLIDMLAWISKASGTPKPSDLFAWLLGELPTSDYRIVLPEGSGGGLYNTDNYNEGMNNQKAWKMLRDGTFNATGFFNWLENEKSINSFRFMYLLNETTPQVINPGDLLFYAMSPNMVSFWDGALAFYYHDALDSQSTANAENILWTFFDSDSFDEEGFFTLLNESHFDIFEMFMELEVNPASWINTLNNKLGIEPIDLIARMLKYNPGTEYLVLTSGASVTFNVLANLTVSYANITLKHLTDQRIADNLELTEADHFSNFIDSDRLTGDNFVIF